MLENEDILIISGQMYHDRYPTCKQNITNELIKRNRVLYVEYNYSWPKLIWGLLGKEDWPVAPLGAIRQEDENLYLLTPPPRLPLRHLFGFVNRLNQQLVSLCIQKALKQIGMREVIFWSFVHEAEAILANLHEVVKLSIYHCVDNWVELVGKDSTVSRRLITEQERLLSNKVDLVFTTARSLKDRLEEYNPNVYYVPNAAKIELFTKALDPKLSPPEDIVGIPRPLIGFVGTFSSWIDQKLLDYIVKKHPQWSFVFIGMVDVTLESFSRKENVHFLGRKQQRELPRYLSELSVGIIPFQVNELTIDVSPLKLFEYLASGCPVVSTKLPEVQRFEGEVVRCADDYEEFSELISELLSDDQDRLAQEALRIALQHDWAARVNEYSRIIEPLLCC